MQEWTGYGLLPSWLEKEVKLTEPPNNKPEIDSTFWLQMDAIRSAAQDLENVEALIKQKKELLKNSKDIKETDRLLAELDGLEWLQRQITRYS
jgi:hypothetical protein